MDIKKIIATLFLAGTIAVVPASAVKRAEPADPATGELLLADPTVINIEGKYYMAGTQPGNPPGFTIFESDDLLHWRSTSPDGLPQLTPGADIYGTKGFWAPQFVPDGDKTYIFYTANEHVACAASPTLTGKYSAVLSTGNPVSAAGNAAVGGAAGTGGAVAPEPIDGSCGNIDPFLFRDTDGKCYLYHVRFDNGNYLWEGEYDLEQGKLVENTLQPTFRVDQPWEHTLSYESVPIMEGPTVVKIGDFYYLFYSANHFESKDYAVGYATAPTPLGPWTKNPDNPVISREIVGEPGSGHGDIFTDKEGQLRYVFHVHNSDAKVAPRRTRIVTLKTIPSANPGIPARIVADPATVIKPVLDNGEVKIVTAPQADAFPIVDKSGRTATFVYDPSDAEVVATAAEAVAGDIALITGETPGLATSLSGVELPIISGTIGQSALIDELAAKGKIDVSDVKGKWEAYGLAVVDRPCKGVKQALVAYGSNPRGTAYALFEISRLMGVSPYVWWADVAPEKRDMLYATPGVTVVGEPSVKFRGIFINDEDWGLMPWAAKNIDSQYENIGPNTYAKVMELLLRLRGNVLWPAMHLCSQAFWDNKDNLPVAKKYDIALGSSHCEQMLRDNEWEWRRYEDKTGTYDNWNYVDNKEKIQRYWEERVKESKGFSAMYTLGMRGVHDWGISGYPTTEDKVRGLTEIIGFQRSLIDKHIGDPTTVPQIFIPYKEVLDAYNAGLQVPEDVILTWVDDNHGYVRQLPTPEEQKRSGGHGVYYHLSYWGTPADYLWLCSTSPSLISYELVKGYENGIKDLWVINVGDIKPAEAELEFCMDLAWDVDVWQPEKAHEYSRHWSRKTFGEEVADELADLKREYYELGAAGKPEHIFGVDFSNAEMDERIERYARLVEKSDEIARKIPQRLQDAYFELIDYPVKGTYNMNVMTFRAKQSLEFARHGEREKALAYAAEAERAHNEIGRLTEKYNTGIADGKWNGMMDSKPRRQKQFDLPARASADSVASSRLSVAERMEVKIPASGYTASRGEVKEIPGLGIGPGSVTVWPMDYTDYGKGRIAEAPFVEYAVPVKKGGNRIEVRCVPSFPVHSGENLDVAISIDGGTPEVCSLKTVATQGKWNHTVLQGYNDATVEYDAPADGTVNLKVSLLNPGIAVSQIYATTNDCPI